MTKKRLLRALAAALLAALCGAAFYFHTYPIKLNLATLDWQTVKLMQGNDGIAPDVKFLGRGVTVGRKEFYLISVDGQFGYVSFERGPLGRHRLRNVGYGDGAFANGVVESGDEKYLLFSGQDHAGAIKKITVELEGKTYQLEPGKTRPFLTCCPVDPNTKAQNADLFDIVFYNEDGADITAEYELSGGRIQ
ncbi:MAG: hypothetical protein IIV90_02060 [Oscillospiraceae bacterium]|nr:hypothetical protein [Oscillospiraceae bacterium]